MARPRLPETTQRPSPRAPPSLRTSSADSSDHQRPRPRYPKPSEPRSTQSEPKKLGTRIANLESQLGLAQEELRSLKGQLVSAKKTAQDQLKKDAEEEKDCSSTNTPIEDQSHETLSKGDTVMENETSDDDRNCVKKETVFFEVPVEKLADEPKLANEPENALLDELVLKNNEISSLKADLVDKDKEINLLRQENELLHSQLDERALKLSSAEANVEELTLRFSNITHELGNSKAELLEKYEKLELSEKAREELENEMKRLRVLSEQWRKAADAAAAVLAGELDIKGQRFSERCGSVDKVYTNSFEGVGRYVGSPGLGGDRDDVFGGDKRKSSAGIKMLGELWKKKGQK